MNLMQQLMQQAQNNNPMFKRAQEMASGKSPEQLEQTARNLCKNMGINFDEAYSQFNSQIKQMQGMMNMFRR